MSLNCGTSKSNIARSACSLDPGPVIGYWFDEISTGLTFANSLLEASWITKINAAQGSRLYIPSSLTVYDSIPEFEDDVMNTSGIGVKNQVRRGDIMYSFIHNDLTDDSYERLLTFHKQRMYVWFVTKGGHISCNKNATNALPVLCDVFVGKRKFGANRDEASSCTVKITIVDSEDFNNYIVIPTAFDPQDLEGIADVELTTVTSDVSSQFVKFYVTKIADGGEVSELTTAADFSVKLTAGSVARTITTVSNVGNYYTLTVTDLTTAAHEIELINQPSMVIKGYETVAAVSFTPQA